MKNDFVRIEEGNLALRILGLAMDAVIMFFIMIGLAGLVMTPIANKAFNYNGIQASQYRYTLASHLRLVYTEDDNGKKTPVELAKIKDVDYDTKDMMLYEFESKDVNFYMKHVKYYYCNYSTGNVTSNDIPKGSKVKDFIAPNYKEFQGKYTDSWYIKKFKSILTETDKDKALTKAKQAVMEATKDFYFQDYYQTGQKKLQNIQWFIILPSFVLSFSIFFIIIPLCFKNGETLGKKTFHLGLLAKDGYSVKKRQIVLRQLTLLLYIGLTSFVVGVGLTSLATCFIGVFIYFVATVIPKSKRSPVDFLAYTIVVDTRKSVWYKDEFEETAMTEEFNKNMKKYRKGPVENKNVIQVGSTIVKEEIRKEVEESQKSSKE